MWVRWSVICCQELGCNRLLVAKLGHTGLVPFVHELGTVCGEVPLEYGFAVLVWSKQHTVSFLMYNCVIFSSAAGVLAGKHSQRWKITQSWVTLWSQPPLDFVPFVDYLPGFLYLVDSLLIWVGGHYWIRVHWCLGSWGDWLWGLVSPRTHASSPTWNCFTHLSRDSPRVCSKKR